LGSSTAARSAQTWLAWLPVAIALSAGNGWQTLSELVAELREPLRRATPPDAVHVNDLVDVMITVTLASFRPMNTHSGILLVDTDEIPSGISLPRKWRWFLEFPDVSEPAEQVPRSLRTECMIVRARHGPSDVRDLNAHPTSPFAESEPIFRRVRPDLLIEINDAGCDKERTQSAPLRLPLKDWNEYF
jgi:hypothetical protein